MKRFITLVMLISVWTISSFAQGITSAAFSGKVSDKASQVLPNANVVAVHEPTGSRFGNISRDDGKYIVTNLTPGGPYTVTVSMVGYSSQQVKNVYVQLGQNLNMNFTIGEEAIEAGEVLVVADAGDVFSSSKMGSGSVVTSKEMNKIPTISRNFEDFYKLSPYFSGSSAAGKNRGYNNIQIDGANYNDLFGLGGTTPGSQSRATPISLDVIEQFQLEVSPYDVKKAGFTGASMNAVTKSGTNQVKGSAYYYGRDEKMIGVAPNALATKYPAFTDFQTGFSIGGPIIENTMFFFANAEIQKNTTPLNRTFGAATQTTNVFTLPIDTLNKMTQILKDIYGYEAGSFETMETRQNSDKVFARLDWNISDEHKLTIRHSFLSALLDNSPSRGRGATNIFAANNRYVIDNKTNSTSLILKSVFGNDFANELVVAMQTQYDKPNILGAAFPMVYLETKAPDNKTYTVLAGAEQFRHRNELDQEVFEVSDNLTYYLGDHTITAGARMESFSFRNLFIPNNFGTYRFTSLYHLEKGLPKAGSYEYQYALATEANPNKENTYAIKWSAITYGGYLQDEWQVNSQLKLSLGARFDLPTYPDKPAYNYKVDSTFSTKGYDIATNKTPKSAWQISPRLGFNLDVTGDRTTQVRGGVGIFSGRVPYVWVSNQYGNTGVEYARLTGSPAAFSADPNNQPGPGSPGLAATTTYEIDITNPNFKNPSILRSSISVDKKLPFDLTATVEYMYSKNLNDIGYQNINLKGITDTINGEGRSIWGTSSTRNINNTFTAVVYLHNTDKGGQSNFSIQLNRNGAEDKVDFLGGYVYGVSEDINSGQSATAFSQWRFNPISTNPNEAVVAYSGWDRRHRAYFSLSYTYDWADGISTNLGMFYNGFAGRGFSYMVDGDVNGDGANGNDLAYIPRDVDNITLINTAGATLAKTDVAYQQMMTFIDNDEYLKNHKGQFAERNGAREPWSHQLDFRATQYVNLMGYNLEFYLNVINLPNLINKANGRIYVVANQSANLFKYRSFDAATNSAKYEWTNPVDPRQPSDFDSRYQMQFGMRFAF